MWMLLKCASRDLRKGYEMRRGLLTTAGSGAFKIQENIDKARRRVLAKGSSTIEVVFFAIVQQGHDSSSWLLSIRSKVFDQLKYRNDSNPIVRSAKARRDRIIVRIDKHSPFARCRICKPPATRLAFFGTPNIDDDVGTLEIHADSRFTSGSR